MSHYTIACYQMLINFLLLLSDMSKSVGDLLSDIDDCINSDSDGSIPPPPPRSDSQGSPTASGTLRNLEADAKSKVSPKKVVGMTGAKVKAVAAVKAAEAEIQAMEVDRDEFSDAILEVNSRNEFLLLKDGSMPKEVNTTDFGMFFHESLEGLLKVLRPFTEPQADEKDEPKPIKISPGMKERKVEEMRKISEKEITRLLSAILLDRGLKFRTKNRNKKVESGESIANKSDEVKSPEITSKEILSASSSATPLTCCCSAMHDLIMNCPVGGVRHRALCAAETEKGRKRKHSESPAPKQTPAVTVKPESASVPFDSVKRETSGRGRGQTRGKRSRGNEGSVFSRGGHRGGSTSSSDYSRSYAQVVKESPGPSRPRLHDEGQERWSREDQAKFGKQRKESPTLEKLKEVQRLQKLGLVPLATNKKQPSATITSAPSSDNIPSTGQFKKLLSNAGHDSASSTSFPGPSNLPRIPKFPVRGKHGDKAVDNQGKILWSQMPLKPLDFPPNAKFEVTVENGCWNVKYVQ